jgi:hypothetical protein
LFGQYKAEEAEQAATAEKDEKANVSDPVSIETEKNDRPELYACSHRDA